MLLNEIGGIILFLVKKGIPSIAQAVFLALSSKITSGWSQGQGLYGTPGIKFGSFTCKASIFPTILSLWTLKYLLVSPSTLYSSTKDILLKVNCM